MYHFFPVINKYIRYKALVFKLTQIVVIGILGKVVVVKIAQIQKLDLQRYSHTVIPLITSHLQRY